MNMETTIFNKLLLKSAFCCMACDGNIDQREIGLIKSICEKTPLLKNLNFLEEINDFISGINSKGKVFLREFFNQLENSELSEEQELTLIDFAIQVIKADEQIEYSEIKFFKNIRHRLKVSNEKILQHFPDIEIYLEEDIITDGFLDKISTQYFEAINLPQFDLSTIVDNLNGNDKEKDE